MDERKTMKGRDRDASVYYLLLFRGHEMRFYYVQAIIPCFDMIFVATIAYPN